MPAVVLVVLAIVLVLVLNSGSGAPQTARVSAPTRQVHRPSRLVARLGRHALPNAVSGEAVVARSAGVLVIGGLDGSDVSTSAVSLLSARTGEVSPAGSLSEPRHDTAGASLGGRVIVFGGGSASELDSVEALRLGASGRTLGRLPTTRSDLSALTVAGKAYVLGGYDGRAPTGVVLRTSDGARFTAVATLPVAFRYGASAAVGQTIYTFGGELANGLDSDAIQALDTRTGDARIIGHLPRPLSHASAVALDGRIYVLGGSTARSATAQIISFDPSTRMLRPAGRLPMRITNAAATTVAGVGYLIGGLDAQGGSLATVVEVRVATRGG